MHKAVLKVSTLLLLCSLFVGAPAALAANSGGCSVVGSSCSISKSGDGTCAQNYETGDIYCRANLGAGSPGSGSGGINMFYLNSYAQSILAIINGLLVPVLLAIAFIVFLWGVFKYFVWGADNDTELEKGRGFVLWGVIGFVVILSVWGLVNLLGATFGLSPGGRAPAFPTL